MAFLKDQFQNLGLSLDEQGGRGHFSAARDEGVGLRQPSGTDRYHLAQGPRTARGDFDDAGGTRQSPHVQAKRSRTHDSSELSLEGENTEPLWPYQGVGSAWGGGRRAGGVPGVDAAAQLPTWSLALKQQRRQSRAPRNPCWRGDTRYLRALLRTDTIFTMTRQNADYRGELRLKGANGVTTEEHFRSTGRGLGAKCQPASCGQLWDRRPIPAVSPSAASATHGQLQPRSITWKSPKINNPYVLGYVWF